MPNQELGELLARGGPDLIKNLVSELPQDESGKLMARFIDLDQEMTRAQAELKATTRQKTAKMSKS